jgi:deoxyribodipyrimidine photo-lyase
MSPREPGESTIVVLFTRDLRVHDHPALSEASKLAERVGRSSCSTRACSRSDFASPNRVAFLLQSLADLDASLRALGGALVVRRGDAVREAVALAGRWRAGRLRERRRQRIRARAGAPTSAGMRGSGNRAPALPRRDDRRTRRAPADRRRPLPGLHAVLESLAGAVPAIDSCAGHGDIAVPRSWLAARSVACRFCASCGRRDLARPGRRRGVARAGASRRVAAPRTRDAIPTVTTISLPTAPHASAPTCTSAASLRRGGAARPPVGRAVRPSSASSAGATSTIRCRPHSPPSRAKTYRPPGDRWSDDAELLALWKEGRTGFPLVDAGMRQLMREGWMHNRARLVTASFLVPASSTSRGRRHRQHRRQLAVGGWHRQ